MEFEKKQLCDTWMHRSVCKCWHFSFLKWLRREVFMIPVRILGNLPYVSIFLSCLTGFPFFIQLQSVWRKNVKKKKKWKKKKGKKRVILFWDAAFGKENVNCGKNRATNDILLKSAKKLYAKCRSWWDIPLNLIKITQRLIYTDITQIVSWWSVTQLSKRYVIYAIYISLL